MSEGRDRPLLPHLWEMPFPNFFFGSDVDVQTISFLRSAARQYFLLPVFVDLKAVPITSKHFSVLLAFIVFAVPDFFISVMGFWLT